jgi:hypothetical protein
MSIADLKTAMAERNVSAAGCFEKQDLVDALNDWKVRMEDGEDARVKEEGRQREEQQRQQQRQQQQQQRQQAHQQAQQQAEQQHQSQQRPSPLAGQTDQAQRYHEDQSYQPPPSGIDKFDRLRQLGFKHSQAIYIDVEGELTQTEYEAAPATMHKAESLGFDMRVLQTMFADYPALFKIDWEMQVDRLIASSLDRSYVMDICMAGYPLVLLEENVLKIEELHGFGFKPEDIQRIVKQWKTTHVSNEQMRVTIKGKPQRARE